MAVQHYTPEELLRLRDSPLVRKPDGLPSIEQWIEYVYADPDSNEKLRIPHSQPQNERQQNQRAQAKRPVEPSPMGSFTSQRPSLLQVRQNLSRVSGTGMGDAATFGRQRELIECIEDIVLGPPKTSFASSRNLSRLSDFAEKGTTPSSAEASLGDESDNARQRLWKERDSERQQNRKSMYTCDGESNINRESWISNKDRKAFGGEENGVERPPRGEGREKWNGKAQRDRDIGHEGEPRRNGFGDRSDVRWNRDENRSSGNNGERPGGWLERKRERERESQNHRPWGRDAHEEKDPEWMDEQLEKEEPQAPRTVEDFQRWKESMKAGSAIPEVQDHTPAMSVKATTPSKLVAPLVLEGFDDNTFGGWIAQKPPERALDGLPTPVKAAPGKGKSSRYAGFFAPKEEPVESSVPLTNTQNVANEVANGTSEDKEGFQRILQMLGGTGIGQATPMTAPEPKSPPPKSTSNGAKPRSRFFDSMPVAYAKIPELMQSPHNGFQMQFNKDLASGNPDEEREMMEEPGNPLALSLPDKRSINERPRSRQAPGSIMSPKPTMPTDGMKDQRIPSVRPQDEGSIFLEGPPSRGAATPDLNIQNLLATQQRAQKPQHLNRDSEFLLNLIQTKATSRPPSQMQQKPEQDIFQLFLDQPPKPHAPKPRAPPPLPGLFDDQLLQNVEPQRREQREFPPGMPLRRQSQRAPPGFFEDPAMFNMYQHQQNRRTFTEPQSQPQPGRRMSGHPSLPQMHPQQQPQMPPDFPLMQSPPIRHQDRIPPPPGFNPNIRHPPGFANIPNIFQAPSNLQHQPQQVSLGTIAQSLPQQQQRPPGVQDVPGFGMPPNAPPGFFGGPPHAPGVPPGFMPGHMQMRGLQDGMMAGRGGGGIGGGIGAGRGYESFDTMGQQRR